VIIEILEKEATKSAEDWAKNKRITDGRYPSVKEYFEMKNRFFLALCRKAYEEIANILDQERQKDEFTSTVGNR